MPYNYLLLKEVEPLTQVSIVLHRMYRIVYRMKFYLFYVPMPRHYYGQYYGEGFASMTDEPERFADYIRHQSFKAICVNDSPAVTLDKYEHIRACVQQAFDEILPDKSSFEK